MATKQQKSHDEPFDVTKDTESKKGEPAPKSTPEPEVHDGVTANMPHPEGPNAGTFAPGEMPRTTKAIDWEGEPTKLSADATTLDIVAAFNKLVHQVVGKKAKYAGAVVGPQSMSEEDYKKAQDEAVKQAEAASEKAKVPAKH